jgi:tetratricopeptide (TPR) repeat protein
MRTLRYYFLFFVLSLGMSVKAQSTKEMLETGNSFMQSGDFTNAIAVLNKAYLQDGSNVEVVKSLSFCYYLNKDYAKALSIIEPMIDGNSGDDACYQIAGNIYTGLAQNKDAEKLYKKAIKKFPDSGPLYSDYGIFLGSLARENESIKIWERGIQADPSYPGNYYYACKYYYPIDMTWALLYGEIFVDMESLTRRTPEIKAMLMDGYKKLFSDDANLRPLTGKKNEGVNEFENAVRAAWRANAGTVTGNVNEESLTMMRSRFILDWFNGPNGAKFPNHLFEYQRQLMQQGMFTAYNQWIFGFAQDEKTYNEWVKDHSDEFNTFNNFQRGRVFKIPKGQYYQTLPQ